MNAKITQDNLYMLLPLKIGWLAPWLSEDKHKSYGCNQPYISLKTL